MLFIVGRDHTDQECLFPGSWKPASRSNEDAGKGIPLCAMRLGWRRPSDPGGQRNGQNEPRAHGESKSCVGLTSNAVRPEKAAGPERGPCAT